MLHFDRQLRLEFHGARITSDAGPLSVYGLSTGLTATVRGSIIGLRRQ